MRQFTIRDKENMRPIMLSIWELVGKGLPGGPVVIEVKRQARSLDMNAKMWPMLTDISEQVEWYGERLTQKNWKDILSASLEKQRAVPGIDGGFVVLGVRTSKMDKANFSMLIELMYAFGTEHNVTWSEPAIKAYGHYRGAE